MLRPGGVFMNSPVDVGSDRYRRAWDLMMKPVRGSETIGFVVGMLLYPFELLLRKLVSEGPSTEIIACRNR
jgi:hypothetical protein